MKQSEAVGLTTIPLLAGLSGEEIARVVSAGRVRTLRDGERIVRSGEVGREMFVLLSGTARVEAELGGARQMLARIERGDVFGEIAFVAAGARTADVVAAEEVRVLEISRAYLERLMGDVPAIAARLLLNLSLILCDRLMSTTRSWLDSEYEQTLALFQTLASQTHVDGVFARFVDALVRAFPQVRAVRLLLGERDLVWPDAAAVGPPPDQQVLAALDGMHVDAERAVVICPVPMDQVERCTLVLTQTRGTTLTSMELALLPWVTTQLGLVVDRILLHEETRALATIDPLTQLYNRNVFNKELAREIARVRRYDTALSLVIADLDHFKAVNDAYGHLAGDECLRAVAATLRRNLRQVDVLCRYGGEELAVLMPMTDAEGARVVAERLRAAIAELAIDVGGRTLRVTISSGVATLRAEDSPRSFFQRADEALYAAKAAGRNRVMVSWDRPAGCSLLAQ